MLGVMLKRGIIKRLALDDIIFPPTFSFISFSMLSADELAFDALRTHISFDSDWTHISFDSDQMINRPIRLQEINMRYNNKIWYPAPYPDVYTDTFIFFLRSLCKLMWMNVRNFPNAPRIKQTRQWR